MPTTLLLAHPDLKSQQHLCDGTRTVDELKSSKYEPSTMSILKCKIDFRKPQNKRSKAK